MEDIIYTIKNSKNIVITFHESPDGDSIGSSLALMQGLKKLHKNVQIISKESVPKYLSFLPFSIEINGYSNEIPANTDCVIVVDCGDVKRINAKGICLTSKTYTLLNIDHHLSNEYYGDYNFVDTSAIAVAEIIYDILKSMDIEIDKDMAECLYTSIITDSGSFKYQGTSLRTHNIAGQLINTGIDFTKIHRMVFDNKPLNKVLLYGEVINCIEVVLDGKVCIMKLTEEMTKKLNMENEDTGDVISLGTQIDTVEVTVLLKEWKSGTKVSLRSKSNFDVRKIAEKFNGGGHTRASGMLLDFNVEKSREIIINAIKEELI
ncbi:DHH family phosphoesterase [Haloimpatiens sp. FM7315]|uniref:DHH family phosphoesterase n=1 Tax=Haloimpatiens sp. FM7315 TaxID=3298609 RepID=UPI0035A31A91